MNLKPYTIDKLSYYVTGDNNKSAYKKTVDLLTLFKALDCKTEIGSMSRREYTRRCLIEINGTDKLKKVLEDVTDPRYLINIQIESEELVNELNVLLYYDDYELKKVGKGYKVTRVNDLAIDINNKIHDVLSNEFIQEQIIKCDEKLAVNDFDGAITNARSLVESVLLELENEITGEHKKMMEI